MDLNEKEMDGTLLLKYVNETVTPEERTQVNDWLSADEVNNATLLQVAGIAHAQQTRQRILQRDASSAFYRVNRRMQRRLARITMRRIAVAASLFIGLFGIGSLVWQKQQVELPPQMITINTNAGMRSQLTLPDGTIVFLNAESMLAYPTRYDGKERRVQLSGEAYFKVAPDTDRPFVVYAANNRMNVRATGTAFNLQAYEKDSLARIVLIEGSVQVGLQEQKEMVSLKPSKMATVDMKTGKVSVQKINTAYSIAWMDGRLIFKDTPMPEVLRQLSHFYSVDFEVQDPVISSYTFTGTFENRPLFQILEYVKISSQIESMMLYPDNQEVRKPAIRLRKEEKR